MSRAEDYRAATDIALSLFDEALKDLQGGKATEDEEIVKTFCGAYKCADNSYLATFFKGFLTGVAKGVELKTRLDKAQEQGASL